MSNKYEMLKVKDKADKYYTKKKTIFDLPFKICLCGKSFLSGKTSVALNLIIRKTFFGNDFLGENIFIVSNNPADKKIQTLIKAKDVPQSNIMAFDEPRLMALYQYLEDLFFEETEDGGRPSNKLVYIDDCGYSASLKGGGKDDGFLSLIACNGRHINLSSIISIQKYTQLSTTYRNNLTGLILFATSQKELETVMDDHNYTSDRKKWIEEYRKATREKHSFFVINYSNDADNRFQDSNFKTIKID